MDRLAMTALMVALLVAPATSCIYEYGSRKESAAKTGVHFTYAYNGLDWVKAAPTCGQGKTQSPIMLPTQGAAADRLPKASAKSTFSYGPLVNPTIVNNGHTLQVVFPATFQSDVKIPIIGDKSKALGASILGSGPVTGTVKATPAQFHFHSHSEHIINGASYPLEMHIVHFIKPDQLPACAPNGCPAVLGIVFALTENENEVSPELRKLINAMPLNEQESATVSGTVDLNALLPKNRTYLTYPGSLTTPPCTEGILWHVLATPMKISQSLLTKYEEAVGDTICGGSEGEEPAPAEEVATAATTNVPKERAFAGTAESSSSAMLQKPAADGDGCFKLANGHNFRDVQPLYGRPLKIAVN